MIDDEIIAEIATLLITRLNWKAPRAQLMATDNYKEFIKHVQEYFKEHPKKLEILKMEIEGLLWDVSGS